MSSFTRPNVRAVVLIAATAMLLSACGHEPVRRMSSAPEVRAPVLPQAPGRTAGERAAIVALRQIGVPYKYGGASRSGFDCSGLVLYSYSAVGQKVPRSTRDQWGELTPVSRGRLRIGDILFFRIDGSISHVGIYLGDERFVHAPSTGRSVSVASLDSSFYRSAFVRGGRPAIGSD